MGIEDLPADQLPPLPPHLQDATKLAGYRMGLVRKMGELNSALERLLRNEKGTLATMRIPGLGGSDQEDPIDRIRKYLEILKKMVAHINRQDGLYGRCGHCGSGIGEAELGELPWADTCRACAAKGLG